MQILKRVNIPTQHFANPFQVTQILFVTLSNIGDAVLTTPSLEALHLQFPNAVIDIVCDKRSAIIFKNCPYLGKLIYKEKQGSWQTKFKLLKALRKKKYDIAVDLRTDCLLYFVKAKSKSFKVSNVKTNNMHSVEKHYAAIKGLVTLPIPLSKIWLSDNEIRLADQALLSISHQRVLAIGIGANFAGKIWPVTSFAELVSSLKPFFDVVFIFGDKNDVSLSCAFKSACDLPSIDFCGKLNLLETAAHLKKASFFIGNDSGLGHIASALALPTFTLFGVGQPMRYRPWGNKAIWYQDPHFEIKNIDALLMASLIIPTLQSSLVNNN